MILDVEIPVLEPFLEMRGFEIDGFSIPPTNREIGGFPVSSDKRQKVSKRSYFSLNYPHLSSETLLTTSFF